MKALVAAHAAAEQFLVGYRSKKRYVKLTAEFSGTHGTGTLIGWNWPLSHPMWRPTWQSSVPDQV